MEEDFLLRLSFVADTEDIRNLAILYIYFFFFVYLINLIATKIWKVQN